MSEPKIYIIDPDSMVAVEVDKVEWVNPAGKVQLIFAVGYDAFAKLKHNLASTKAELEKYQAALAVALEMPRGSIQKGDARTRIDKILKGDGG